MVFLDSNVLVYAIDVSDKRKNEIATSIVEDALGELTGYAIAVQTLSEFVNVAIGKLKKPHSEVAEFLESYKAIPLICPDAEIVSRGLEIKNRYDIQFYDAMMLAAAERAGATEFYTEDLNDGQLYCDIKAVNPFK